MYFILLKFKVNCVGPKTDNTANSNCSKPLLRHTGSCVGCDAEIRWKIARPRLHILSWFVVIDNLTKKNKSAQKI